MKSLNFLTHSRSKSRQFAVIGLGRFGRAVCTSLHHLGYEVLGTDIDEKLVTQVLTQKSASHAVQLDSTEPESLKEAGIFEMDTVIVAIGNYLQESIITTLNVKEAGVEQVVAKASSQIHGKLLERVGADLVVFPEYEAGCNLAKTLTQPGVLEHFELDKENSIVEVLVPEEFHGQTLSQLDFRKRYGLNVLAISNGDKFITNPSPEQVLKQGLVMVVIGSNKNLQRLPIKD